MRIAAEIVAMIGLATAACGCKGSSPKHTRPDTPAAPGVNAPHGETTVPAKPIPTDVLVPEPIVVALDALPAPFATRSARKGPNVVDVPSSPRLRVPAGFRVNVFAENLVGPRWLALTPEGDVLVTETRKNRIRALRDTDGDGAADDITTFADADNGVEIPFGMAFAGGAFYLGNTAEVRRYAFSTKLRRLKGQGERIIALTPGGYRQHWTRNVVASPDGEKLFVSIGSRTNVDVEALPRAAVQVMNLDGSGAAVFAHGLRNPVGLDFHPLSRELYVTVNERDELGDDLVPDYFTRIRQGEFFGWPFAYLAAKNLDPRRVVAGKSENPALAAKTRTPDVLFQAHSAALGLQFYDGTSFPRRYRNGAFVAFRGSWNRDRGTGYKLVFVPFGDDNRPSGGYEDFVTGFLLDPSGPTTWGRPVGLLVLPDGSLLFTEEANNRIYRVAYAP